MTWTFLALNGARWTAAAKETEDFILQLHADGTFDFEHLYPWLQANIAS